MREYIWYNRVKIDKRVLGGNRKLPRSYTRTAWLNSNKIIYARNKPLPFHKTGGLFFIVPYRYIDRNSSNNYRYNRKYNSNHGFTPFWVQPRINRPVYFNDASIVIIILYTKLYVKSTIILFISWHNSAQIL